MRTGWVVTWVVVPLARHSSNPGLTFMCLVNTLNIHSVRDDVPIHNKTSVVTSSISISNPPTQSSSAHRGRMCVCVHMGECMPVYTSVSQKKKEKHMNSREKKSGSQSPENHPVQKVIFSGARVRRNLT
jgi:hypothetical protein